MEDFLLIIFNNNILHSIIEYVGELFKEIQGIVVTHDFMFFCAPTLFCIFLVFIIMYNRPHNNRKERKRKW